MNSRMKGKWRTGWYLNKQVHLSPLNHISASESLHKQRASIRTQTSEPSWESVDGTRSEKGLLEASASKAWDHHHLLSSKRSKVRDVADTQPSFSKATSHIVCFLLKKILDALSTPHDIPYVAMQWSAVELSLPSQASESGIRQGLPAPSAHQFQVMGSISFPIISHNCSNGSELAFLVLF